MKTHRLHDVITSEVHARPFQRLKAPIIITHLAVAYPNHMLPLAAEAVRAMAASYGLLGEGEESQFFFIRGEKMAVRFETHNEFYSVSLLRFDLDLNADRSWIDCLPGELICGVDVVFRKNSADLETLLHENDTHNQIIASEVMNGAALLWTDFVPRKETGFSRIYVEDRSLFPFQAGRLLQRICEIESYRHVALLALPQAQAAMPLITELDGELADITHKLAQKGEDEREPAELLSELMTLAAKLGELSAETANRFSATEAYFAMLDTRLSELREERIEGLQTVSQFMERRLEPARRTCRAADIRIERLSSRVARVTELIRSQVDLSIEQQNRDLLKTLNSRASRQLGLQAKLESITIIVAAYYGFDMLERTIRNTMPNDDIRTTLLMGLSFSVPFIGGALWLYMRRVIRRYHDD
ncbi:MAG: DUF3422 family protein [Pontibacterium sp.]